MPLQTGRWTIVLDGYHGTLIIDSVEPNGSILGRLEIPSARISAKIDGFWDEQAGMITLSTWYPSSSPNVLFMLFGYIMKDSMRMVGIQGSEVFTLTGYAQAFLLGTVDMEISADHNELGWY